MTLRDLTKRAPTLQKLFEIVKDEELYFSPTSLSDHSPESLKILEAHSDYALLEVDHRPGFKSQDVEQLIMPYGGAVCYVIAEKGTSRPRPPRSRSFI